MNWVPSLPLPRQGVPVIGAMAVAFGCPYQGEVPLADVLRIAEAYVENGAAALMLSDTAGMASPTRVERLVRRTRDRFGEIRLILHFHNNRGMAMANLLAALDRRGDRIRHGPGGDRRLPLRAARRRQPGHGRRGFHAGRHGGQHRNRPGPTHPGRPQAGSDPGVYPARAGDEERAEDVRALRTALG